MFDRRTAGSHESHARTCAVIGDPIAHSLSPVLHRAAYRQLALDWSYEAIAVSKEELPAFLASIDQSWAGVSVTMPHKQHLADHLDIIDPLAEVTGAINTIIVQEGGRERLLVGANTDVAGIVRAVREYYSPDSGTLSSLAILGARATASSAIAAGAQLGCTTPLLLARSIAGPGSAYAAAHQMGITPGHIALAKHDQVREALASSQLVISTLPATVADPYAEDLAAAFNVELPPTGSAQLPLAVSDALAGHYLLDVTYDPWPSRLSQAYAALGATVIPGWLMLLHQGVEQVRLFTGQNPDVQVMRAALEKAIGRAS